MQGLMPQCAESGEKSILSAFLMEKEVDTFDFTSI